MKALLYIFFLILFVCQAKAQSVYGWPEDTTKAQNMWALLSDAVKAENFADGKLPFEWLQQNAPQLHVSLYMHGEKLFKGLADNETVREEKRQYQERVLELYDLRMQYFHDEANVINRKLLAAYQYYRPHKDRYRVLKELFNESFRQYAADFLPANLIAYMDVIRLSRNESPVMSDGEMLEKYDQIAHYLQLTGKNVTEKQDILDKILAATVQLDCNLIDKKFGAPFLNDQDKSIHQAKRIIALGLAYDCHDHDAFLQAARLVQEQEPSFGVAKMLAVTLDQQKKYEEAEKYYQEAVNLASEESKKLAILYSLAQHYQRRDMKQEARNTAEKLINASDYQHKAHKLIGDLYFSSFESCKSGESATQDRAVYIAAYQQYQLADRDDLMTLARQQFPSVEEIFQEQYQEGQQVQVGCWIQEQVTLQKRIDLP